MLEKRQLFGFMMDRIKDVGSVQGLAQPQAFGRWFVDMYFESPQDVFVSDGSRDGKVDIFLTTHSDETVQYQILNTKFTRKFGERAPVAFYDEITRFWQAFANKPARKSYLENVVRSELRQRYRKLFDRYDAGAANLMFVTNHTKNESQYASIKNCSVEIFHLEDVLQFMADYIEGAMPRTPPMTLTGIRAVLTADKRDTEVSTSIVFARLSDFVDYMQRDLYGLLFARNVRLSLGNTPVNKEIRETYRNAPHEFAFSNNGITLLCEKHSHDPGSQELTLENPRVVNGSQTLHSIRDVGANSSSARVMVRIIEVPRPSPEELGAQASKRKGIIHKVSIRSNLQNPIKKWNLVSNDDFQQELARYLRKRKLYYERREKEWSYRRTELRSLGVRRGPSLKVLAQLISSYHWRNPVLGPAIAKVSVSSLFEDRAYTTITKTPPELAYRIYLLGEILGHCVSRLAARKRYIRNIKKHIGLALFALVSKSLEGGAVYWNKSESQWQPDEASTEPSNRWISLTEGAARHLFEAYKKQSRIHRRSTGFDLSLNNFFKSQAYVGKILNAPTPNNLRNLARRIGA